MKETAMEKFLKTPGAAKCSACGCLIFGPTAFHRKLGLFCQVCARGPLMLPKRVDRTPIDRWPR